MKPINVEIELEESEYPGHELQAAITNHGRHVLRCTWRGYSMKVSKNECLIIPVPLFNYNIDDFVFDIK